MIDREKVEGREGESKVDSTPSRQGHNRIDIEGTSIDDVLHEHEGLVELMFEYTCTGGVKSLALIFMPYKTRAHLFLLKAIDPPVFPLSRPPSGILSFPSRALHTASS